MKVKGVTRKKKGESAFPLNKKKTPPRSMTFSWIFCPLKQRREEEIKFPSVRREALKNYKKKWRETEE